MKRIALIALAILLPGSAALAAISPQDLANQFAAQGYTAIEITQGRTQTKIEASNGTQKIEEIYDTSTGTLLKREVEAAEAGDDIRNGVRLRNRDRDFVRVVSGLPSSGDDSSDDDSNDDDRGHGNDDDHADDDNPGRGSGGHGADDDGDDDHGGGRGRGGDRDDDDDSDDDDDRSGKDDSRGGGGQGRGRGRGSDD